MEKTSVPMVPPIMVQGIKINRIKTTTYIWTAKVPVEQEQISLDPKKVLKNLLANVLYCPNMSTKKREDGGILISIDDIVQDTIIRTQWLCSKEQLDLIQ